MLSIEKFAEQHFGIKLTKYQIDLIKLITENPEKEYVLHYPSPKAAGKTTAYKIAMAYLQEGLKDVGTGNIYRRALEWALSSDTGVSSETMCAFFLGIEKGGYFGMQAPSDASDRGRCIRLLERIPEWIPRLDELKALDTGTISINGAAAIPKSEDSQSWTQQVPLIIKEGGFEL